MNYQRYIEDQKSLADIGYVYKHDPEFHEQLDACPQSIFCGDMAKIDCEINIKQNSDEIYYFVLEANVNQALEDEDSANIFASKWQVVGHDDGKEVLCDPSTGDLYRRYKQDSDDPMGQTHFIKVRHMESRPNGMIHEYLPIDKHVIRMNIA